MLYANIKTYKMNLSLVLQFVPTDKKNPRVDLKIAKTLNHLYFIYEKNQQVCVPSIRLS